MVIIMSDIIAAVATGNVRSAIGIIRVSGDGAIDAVSRVFRPRKYKTMADAPSGRLVYGELLSEEGQVIDLCLCTVSRAPGSYTGEDTAEIQCHGSPVVLSEGLRTLFSVGVRQALPGEFTKRAFLNGKLDLTAAEAVIDLIDAETADTAKNACGQLSGSVSGKTDAVYSSLLDMAAHFHAVVDWPDEDIEDFQAENYTETLENAERELSRLLDTFSRGRILREGVKCAIIGRPNVGKSSLLNALLGYERAIVTDVAGTTRDTLEEKCVLGGVLLRLIDTAGIRDTDDAVEKLGVERAEAALRDADLVFVAADASEPLNSEDMDIIRMASESGKTWVFLPNKTDLTKNAVSMELMGIDAPETIPISAKTGDGLDRLGEYIKSEFGAASPPAGEILTNARQAQEVRIARDALLNVLNGSKIGVTPDVLLTELEDAMNALAIVSGKNLRENIIDKIFTRFCVGK